MSKQRIGFIGLGAMGVGMAANVAKAGFPLTVLGHSRREPVERLIQLGASEVSSAAELSAASDIVIVCVTTSDIVEELVLGDTGLLATEDAQFLLIDCGTSKPESTLMLGEKLAERGCGMLDVPLGRSAVAAEAGTLNMMAGGSPGDFEKARVVLECLSENLFHLGPLGTGHRIKLINNAYSMSVAALAAETMSVAKAGGIDLQLVHQVMGAGPNKSDFFDWMMAAVLEGNEKKLEFSIENGHKDLGYFNAMAEAVGVRAEIPIQAEAALGRAVEQGHGKSFVPALMRLLAP